MMEILRRIGRRLSRIGSGRPEELLERLTSQWEAAFPALEERVAALEQRTQVASRRPDQLGSALQVRGFDRMREGRNFLVAHQIWKLSRIPVEPPSSGGKPFFSVILVARDRADVVEGALRSLAAQTFSSWEAIVVDDGSRDGTRSVLERWSRIEPRLRVVTRAPEGAAAARNAGLLEVCGDVVAWLDSDNTFAPGYLEDAAWWFLSDPDLVAAYGAQVVVREWGTCVRWPACDLEKLEGGNFIDLNAFLHRRSVGEKFDTSLPRLMDWDYILRIADRVGVRAIPVMAGMYHDGKRSDRITLTQPHGPSLEAVRRKRRPRARRGLRVLWALWHFPQATESYIRSDLEGARALGVDVEVWAQTTPCIPHTNDVPVHRGTLDEAIDDFQPHVVHTYWLSSALDYADTVHRRGIPHTCKVHGFEFNDDTMRRLDAHPATARLYLFGHLRAKVPWTSPKFRTSTTSFLPSLYPPAPCAGKDRRLVLRVGAGLLTKGYRDFFSIARDCPRHRFILVLGRALLMEEKVEEIIAWRDELGSPVEIKVSLPHEEVAALMAQAGIYLHTTNPESVFGMPISIAEAMATGAWPLVRACDGSESYLDGAGAVYHSAGQAAELINQTLAWDEEKWTEVWIRSLDRAWSTFPNEQVMAPIVADWHEIAIRNGAALSPAM